ncbi:FUSC family protein [Saccharibacter sp. 17.LH.SD]|uniref:FUSC family protein n=1 Tax=Saccharibacter sp. 17.LH.SD TaxID=2689393 RepID=UPI00136C76B7|nr:FUSC family protein [Saccharibacter sp. 17.LH.SD]
MSKLTFTPSFTRAAFFSLRTTIASLVALAIAFWMELGEPQWAAMTVWIVAQNSRGMSLSKGRWRVVGTLAGMVAAIVLIAAFPQSTWLFFPALALWLGLCAGLASMTQNFRGYALVLAGYTGAIIAISAAEQPDNIFYIAVARGTYILLGVVCEMVAGMIFVPGAARKAREDLQKKLSHTMSSSALALGAIMRGEPEAVDRLCTQLGSLQSFNDQLEFIRIDMHDEGRDVNRAYVTLGGVAVVLSRGLGLRSRMASVGVLASALREDLTHFADGITELASLLSVEAKAAAQALEKGEELLKFCRQKMAVYLPRNDQTAIQEGIVLTGVEVLLEDMCAVLSSHLAGVQRIGMPEHHRLHRRADIKMAFLNAIRTMAAILFGAFIWEITAWPHGTLYVIFIALVCARFSTFDNSVLISRHFFYGAVWAVIAGIVPVFVVMPITSSYTVLSLVLGTLMFLGGVALRYPPTAVMAASYVNFLPWVLGLDNQGRVSELEWFNVCLALLLALWSGVLVFQIVLPFSLRHAWDLLRRQLLAGLRHIGERKESMRQYDWVDDTTQRMEQAFRFAGQLPKEQVDRMIHGTLSVVTVGRNLLMLRKLTQDGRLPREAVSEGEELIEALTRPGAGEHHFSPEASMEFRAEQDSLGQLFLKTKDLAVRRDLALAMGALRIMRFELPIGQAFLNEPLILSGKTEGLG